MGAYRDPALSGLDDVLGPRFPADPGPATAEAAQPHRRRGHRRRDSARPSGSTARATTSTGAGSAASSRSPSCRSPRAGTIGAYEPVTIPLNVTNDFKSGLYEVDAGTVLAPLGVLQRALLMAPSQQTVGFDPMTGLGGEPVEVSRPRHAGGGEARRLRRHRRRGAVGGGPPPRRRARRRPLGAAPGEAGCPRAGPGPAGGDLGGGARHTDRRRAEREGHGDLPVRGHQRRGPW